MANVFRTIGRKFKLSTKNDEGTATYIIGDVSDGFVGTWSVHIVDTGSLSANIVVKARTNHPLANDDAVPFVAIPYCKQYLNGVVADMTYVTTTITTTSIIMIPATGLDVALDVTFTSGTGTIYTIPCEGAAC